MEIISKSTRIVFVALFFAGLVGCSELSAQGHYAPVSKEDLVGAKFTYYYDAKMKLVQPPDFTWTFTSSNLVIKAGSGDIPDDLLKLFAGPLGKVKTIKAGWRVKDGELTVSGPDLDGVLTRTMVSLPILRTAPTVIRIGKHQYTFIPAK